LVVTKLFLILSCSLGLKAEHQQPALDEISFEQNEEVDVELTRKFHCKLTARELNVCGSATIESLEVLGNQTIGGNSTVTGNEAIAGTLYIAGNEIVGGNVSVGGTLFTTSLFVGGVDITGLVTGAANTCTTSDGFFINKTGDILNFKCLVAGAGITLTSTNNTISISATSTVVVAPIVTTTTIGGILGYAGAANTATTVIATGANAVFNLVEPSFSILPRIPDAASFTVPIGGTYYFQYIVRGTPDVSLTPPAPLVFELTSNGTSIPCSRFGSDTQTTSLPASDGGGTLTVRGFVVAALPAGAVIHLHNVSGTPIQLNSTANQGGVAGPVADSATLIVERLT